MLFRSITGSWVGRGGGGPGNSPTMGRDGSGTHGAGRTSATANTGAGAFGNYGYSGASGVVIIRYKFQ